MADCASTLAKGIQSTCDDLKKVGGLDKRIYGGTTEDLDAVVFGTDNSVTSMTFKATKGLVQFIGKVDKHNDDINVEVGENVNIRTHILNMLLGITSSAQLKALDDLIDTEKLFFIVETRAGQLEVFGLNKTNFDSFGMKVNSLSMPSGTLLNDSTLATIGLQGGLTNVKLVFGPANSLSANITTLDGLTIDPAPASS